MVVADHQQHAAERARASRIGVPQRVAGTVQPRRLAVPHAEHAVAARAREQPDLLASPHRGCGEILVQAGLEDDALRLEVGGGLPQPEIQSAQGRAAIAGNEAGGVQAVRGIGLALLQGQSRQRLDAGKKAGCLAKRRRAFDSRGSQRVQRTAVAPKRPVRARRFVPRHCRGAIHGMPTVCPQRRYSPCFLAQDGIKLEQSRLVWSSC